MMNMHFADFPRAMAHAGTTLPAAEIRRPEKAGGNCASACSCAERRLIAEAQSRNEKPAVVGKRKGAPLGLRQTLTGEKVGPARNVFTPA
jgi:hypothetical protein